MDDILQCSAAEITAVSHFAIPCTWATEQRIRVHFEWVYDGYYIYLVQADEEAANDGINPRESMYLVLYDGTKVDFEFLHISYID